MGMQRPYKGEEKDTRGLSFKSFHKKPSTRGPEEPGELKELSGHPKRSG